jgi:hypothetical protein
MVPMLSKPGVVSPGQSQRRNFLGAVRINSVLKSTRINASRFTALGGK